MLHPSKYPAWATISDSEMVIARAHYLKLLNDAYEAYQLENVTPFGISVIASAKDRGDILAAATSDGSWVNADAWDCVRWLRLLFVQYSERREAMQDALNPHQLQAVSLDFSDVGDIPHTAPEMDQQNIAWDIANIDGLTGLPNRV